MPMRVGEVLLDSLLDTLKLLPFLVLLYILIELLEHKTAMGRPNRALSGKFAPLIGSAAGLVPMCGFSVMASKLYERRHLTLGTLIAVFVATSDEALLVLLLSPVNETDWGFMLGSVGALLAVKFVLGFLVGYLIDLLMTLRRGDALSPAEFFEEGEKHGEPHACEHTHESKWQLYLVSPLLHALKVSAAVLVCNLLFGFLFLSAGGEEQVVGFLSEAGYWFQPLFSCLVGLVPNCASSVAIAEVYARGGLAFGGLLGGLVTNAGLGVLVLFRNFRAWKRNLGIFALTLLLGLAAGYAGNALLLLF